MSIAVVRLEDNASLWDVGREQGVTRFRYLTHPELVNEVCPDCLYFHDTVSEIGGAGVPDPPLHPLCACTIEPEFDEGTVLGQDPDGNPIMAEPPPAKNPGEHLSEIVRSMKAPEQIKLLGPTRTKLVRSGAMDPADLVSRTKGTRKVDNLLRSLAITRAELPNLSHEQLRKLAEARLGRRRRQRVAQLRRQRPNEEALRRRPYQVLGPERSLNVFVPRVPMPGGRT